MNSDRCNGYGFLIVIVIGLALCVWAWCCGQSLTDGAPIQRFSASAAAVAAVVGFLAFAALVFYTNETRCQRKVAENQVKAAEDQLEASIKPVVLFDIASGEYVPGQRLSLNAPQLRNIGLGPAFGVVVDPIVGTDVSLNIECVPLIESKDKECCSWSIAQGGQHGGMARQPALLDEQFDQGKIPDGTQVVVHCKGLSGRRYHSLHEIRIDPTVRIWTEFVRLESTKD